jgi:hypothetical protein
MCEPFQQGHFAPNHWNMSEPREAVKVRLLEENTYRAHDVYSVSDRSYAQVWVWLVWTPVVGEAATLNSCSCSAVPPSPHLSLLIGTQAHVAQEVIRSGVLFKQGGLRKNWYVVRTQQSPPAHTLTQETNGVHSSLLCSTSSVVHNFPPQVLAKAVAIAIRSTVMKFSWRFACSLLLQEKAMVCAHSGRHQVFR